MPVCNKFSWGLDTATNHHYYESVGGKQNMNGYDENGLDIDGLPKQLTEEQVSDAKKSRPRRKRHFVVRSSNTILYVNTRDPGVEEQLWVKKAIGPFKTKAAAKLFIDLPRLVSVAEAEKMYRTEQGFLKA